MADSEKNEQDKGKGRKNAKKKTGSKPAEDKSKKMTTAQTSKPAEDEASKQPSKQISKEEPVTQVTQKASGDADELKTEVMGNIVKKDDKENIVKKDDKENIMKKDDMEKIVKKDDKDVASVPDMKDTQKESGAVEDVQTGSTEEKSDKADVSAASQNQKNETEKLGKQNNSNQSTEELVSDNKDTADTSNTVSGTPKSQDIPRSVEKEHTPEQDKVLDELSEVADESGSWGWGKSLLKTASRSVTTFTQQVGEGFTTFVETIETGLGAPPVDVLARNTSEVWETERNDNDACPATEQPHKESSEITKPTETDRASVKEAEIETETESETKPEGCEEKQTAEAASGWFSGWGVGNLTSKIQNTGKSFISGSLDAVEAVATGGLNVLETIGKKTIDVLNEHDPEFKRTKNILFHKKDKVTLSQVLRDAKDQAEHRVQQDQEAEESRKANFGAMFDEFQGLAHLEALEILSNQSEKQVQMLLAAMTDETVAALKPQLVRMKNTFELEDNDDDDQQEHEFSKLVTEHLSELHLGTTPDKINKTQEKIRQWITDFYTKDEAGEKTEPKEIHQCAIQSLAEISAKAVEQFHKAGELLLLQKDSDRSCYDRAKSLASFTQVLCTEIGILSTKFSQCLNKAAEDIEDSSLVTPMVTNIFLEASNSSTYIQDAFCLLLPVLQQAEIQSSQTTS
ncbi:protein FAM114A2-like [Gigantopelta aegis]|uniref:protein FAM114A2-like n=1 Tax=Gigantopelta aegis TaxID=1735272 RepID=UPI001B88BF9D|nr:protein FAM114A2-like [Gigantopelta aegis]